MKNKMQKKGKLIVLDGIDGSGKGTQTGFLVDRLKTEGFPVETISFPSHGEDSAILVDQYLNGLFGLPTQCDPKLVSGFYAIDRFLKKPRIEKWLAQGTNVIADRYTSANMGHQGAKIKEERLREQMFDWIMQLEYGILRLPIPDLNLFIEMKPEIAYGLIEKKDRRAYTGDKHRDGHEGDLNHLIAAHNSFAHVARICDSNVNIDQRLIYRPYNWKVIECDDGKKPLPLEFIHELVWEAVEKCLEK